MSVPVLADMEEIKGINKREAQMQGNGAKIAVSVFFYPKTEKSGRQ